MPAPSSLGSASDSSSLLARLEHAEQRLSIFLALAAPFHALDKSFHTLDAPGSGKGDRIQALLAAAEPAFPGSRITYARLEAGAGLHSRFKVVCAAGPAQLSPSHDRSVAGPVADCDWQVEAAVAEAIHNAVTNAVTGAQDGSPAPFAAASGGHPFAEGRTFSCDDIADQSSPESVFARSDPFLAGIAASGIRAFAAAYVRHPHRAGVVFASSARPRPWTEEDRTILQDLASTLSVVLRSDEAEHERGQIDHHLRESQKMQAVGHMAGGIAHDFNNLLTAMMIYCGLLGTALSRDARLRRHVEEIRTAGERASKLVHQLLGLARQQSMSAQPVSLRTVALDIAELLERAAGDQVQVRFRMDAGLRLACLDGDDIERVLLALTLNACDAMPEGGRLEIAAGNHDVVAHPLQRKDDPAAGPYVELRVSDTGAGMDAGTLAQIFEPFFTTKTATKTPTKTATKTPTKIASKTPTKATSKTTTTTTAKTAPPESGLGLSMVHSIVKQYGGHISVESQPGRGASFRILFPAEVAADVATTAAAGVSAAAALISAPGSQPGPPLKKTLLLVEDEKVVRLSLTATLEAAGYRVLVAAGGQEAVRLSQDFPDDIDLLITSLMMPGMNGRDRALGVSQSRPLMKTLFISGYTDDPLTRRLLDETVDFCRKPFSPPALLAKVDQMLLAPPAVPSGGGARTGAAASRGRPRT